MTEAQVSTVHAQCSLCQEYACTNKQTKKTYTNLHMTRLNPNFVFLPGSPLENSAISRGLNLFIIFYFKFLNLGCLLDWGGGNSH